MFSVLFRIRFYHVLLVRPVHKVPQNQQQPQNLFLVDRPRPIAIVIFFARFQLFIPTELLLLYVPVAAVTVGVRTCVCMYVCMYEYVLHASVGPSVCLSVCPFVRTGCNATGGMHVQ